MAHVVECGRSLRLVHSNSGVHSNRFLRLAYGIQFLFNSRGDSCRLFQTNIHDYLARPCKHVSTRCRKTDSGVCYWAPNHILSFVASLHNMHSVILAAFSDETYSALLFFSMALLFLAITAIVYAISESTPLFRQYTTVKTTKNSAKTNGLNSYGPVIRSIWPYILTCFLNQFVTLSVFPGIVTYIQPADYDCENVYHTRYFVPLWTYLWTFAWAVVASYIPKLIKSPPFKKPIPMIIFASCRAIFLVLLPMCNINPSNRKTPVLIRSDGVYIIIMALLLSTQSYQFAIYSNEAPKRVAKEQRELVGNILSVTLSVGQLAGSVFVFAIIAIM